MSENVLTLLEKEIPNLTMSQRKVADYIMKNAVDVAFMTIEQLSNLVKTSTTTIVRLTISIGYSGYSEFQTYIPGIYNEGGSTPNAV